MTTTSTVRMTFDDSDCQVERDNRTNFTLRDDVGNQITISLRAILRCLSIAEHEKLVANLPDEFWQSAERHK